MELNIILKCNLSINLYKLICLYREIYIYTSYYILQWIWILFLGLRSLSPQIPEILGAEIHGNLLF
jgi:hypothetical protein